MIGPILKRLPIRRVHTRNEHINGIMGFEVNHSRVTGHSPGNKLGSRLFPSITDGVKRRRLLRNNPLRPRLFFHEPTQYQKVRQAFLTFSVFFLLLRHSRTPRHFLIAAPFRGINSLPGGSILFTCEKFR
jgi:hypothetical protein